jgi:Mrp family chromosome partitioning ATPase
VVAVASGKGGVGKSTVASNLAIALGRAGHRVGLLDVDIYGPSLPTMFGIDERPVVIGNRIRPFEKYGIKLMSLGFILDTDTPVIWRGPMVMKAIEQMLGDVDWGALDFLILDMPPGTGDAQLTVVQKVPVAGAVIVTTPQDVALFDARKGLAMFRKVEVPVLGIVENMSTFVCPNCGHETHVFRSGGGERTALELDTPFLGSVPLGRGDRRRRRRRHPDRRRGRRRVRTPPPSPAHRRRGGSVRRGAVARRLSSGRVDGRGPVGLGAPSAGGGGDDDHAAAGVAGDVARDAAEHEALEPGAAVGAEDDEVDGALVELGEDLVARDGRCGCGLPIGPAPLELGERRGRARRAPGARPATLVNCRSVWSGKGERTKRASTCRPVRGAHRPQEVAAPGQRLHRRAGEVDRQEDLAGQLEERRCAPGGSAGRSGASRRSEVEPRSRRRDPRAALRRPDDDEPGVELLRRLFESESGRRRRQTEARDLAGARPDALRLR